MKRLLIGVLASLLLSVSLVNAQTNSKICFPTNSGLNNCQPVTASNPFPVAATASIGGFLSNGSFTNLTATNLTSASTALPTGTSVNIKNTGTTAVSCTFATGAATGVINNIVIQPGSSVSRVVGTFDHIACIDQTGSASNVVVLEGGSGLGNDSGGGGSGGGGGAVTLAAGSVASGAYLSGSFAIGAGVDGWNVVEGTKADAPCGGGASTCTINARLGHLENAAVSPLPGISATQTGAAASSLVIKASPGSLISVSGSAVSGSYIMLFDAVSAPVDGAVTPKKCWGPMAASGPFVFGWGVGPVLSFATGITAVSSSTGCFTKTATNANFIAGEFQ